MSSTAASTSVTDLPPASAGGLWLPMLSLWQREMVRFFRQRNRVVSSLATPLVIWVFLGAGFNHLGNLGQAAGGGGYQAFFFPGVIVLMLLFTAIFSTVSVIEERREGFLQGVLVAPIPRLAIVMGKVLGGASIAMIQGLIFLLLWPLVGAIPPVGWALAAVGVMALLSLGLTALGLCIAWPMDSTAAFHAVMLLFLMPLWFLSGAMFPLATAQPWIRFVVRCNPLTYGQAAFTEALMGGKAEGMAATFGPALLVTVLSVAGMLWLAGWLMSRPRKDGGL